MALSKCWRVPKSVDSRQAEHGEQIAVDQVHGSIAGTRVASVLVSLVRVAASRADCSTHELACEPAQPASLICRSGREKKHLGEQVVGRMRVNPDSQGTGGPHCCAGRRSVRIAAGPQKETLRHSTLTRLHLYVPKDQIGSRMVENTAEHSRDAGTEELRCPTCALDGLRVIRSGSHGLDARTDDPCGSSHLVRLVA